MLLPLACGEDTKPLPGVEVGCAWFEEANCYRASIEEMEMILSQYTRWFKNKDRPMPERLW